MAKNAEQSKNAKKIGNIIYNHRMDLSLKRNSREYFINDRSDMNLLPINWISTKSLTNIELGKNFPSYTALKLLSIALEIDFIDLIQEVDPYMPQKLNNNF
jgi:transcriptional regulator with XRE-family HTH domain